MQKQKKNKVIAILEQLLPVVLAVICILVMTLNSKQSLMAIPLSLNFEGEYSFDGGESTGINEVLNKVSKNGNIYNAAGQIVAKGNINTINNLPAGVYIVNGMKVTKQ